jgi:hypothetical protein
MDQILLKIYKVSSTKCQEIHKEVQDTSLKRIQKETKPVIIVSREMHSLKISWMKSQQKAS